MRNRSILVRVPATVGNVGGAHLQTALALDASLNVKVTRKEDGHLNIRYFGENGEGVPRDRTNLTARAFESALHYRALEFTGADFEAYSTIPVGFGLGASTAAVWAGLVSANLLYELGLDQQTLFDLAGVFEARAANLHAAWMGGLIVASLSGSGCDRSRVSPEFSLTVLVLKRGAAAALAPPGPANLEAEAGGHVAQALAAYLSKPESGKPAFAAANLAVGCEDLAAVAATIEAAGLLPVSAFRCGGGPAVGFLVRGLTPESALNVQETLLRRGLARKVWNLRPANSGTDEWNATATYAPAPVEVGEEMDLAQAANTAA